MKNTSVALLTIILVGLSLWFPSNNNIVSSQTIVNISGYILDPNGNGVAGATITFHLLPIFRSASTNSSGYYEVTTYSGNNDVSISPPSNSNYVQFYQSSFNVQSMTTNFTLSLGYRLSGYVLDQNLTPVSSWFSGGVGIFLDTYWSGKWADSNGSFYVVAPPGNHTIYAKKMGQVVYSGISIFGDYEVINNTALNLNDNVVGNIIINFTNSTPLPTIAPTNTASPTSVSSPTSTFSTTSTATATPYPSQSPTPTSTIPELPILVILPLFLSIFSIAIILKHRKPALLSEQI
jgi:hypothetical protein